LGGAYAQKIVFVFGSCFSGSFYGHIMQPEGVVPDMPVKDQNDADADSDAGRAVYGLFTRGVDADGKRRGDVDPADGGGNTNRDDWKGRQICF
jgi:hypothetical protein